MDHPALDAAAAIVGHHYPVSIMPVSKNRTFYDNLWTLTQRLWSSEEYSTYSDTNGARCLAKLFNRNYVDANLTAIKRANVSEYHYGVMGIFQMRGAYVGSAIHSD